MQSRSSFSGTVPVSAALALLASLRDLDTPDDPEALAESDLPLNLRRRLGLSNVVGEQIRRYEKRKEDVSATEVVGLFELIGRRPDASHIFLEAGRRIARYDLDERRLAARVGLRLLPQGVRRRRAWSLVRRITRRLSPGAVVHIDHKSGTLVVEQGLTAVAAGDSAGCAVLAGAIERVFSEYRAGPAHARHTSCDARGDGRCTWEVEPATGDAPAPDGAGLGATGPGGNGGPSSVGVTNGARSGGVA